MAKETEGIVKCSNKSEKLNFWNGISYCGRGNKKRGFKGKGVLKELLNDFRRFPIYLIVSFPPHPHPPENPLFPL